MKRNLTSVTMILGSLLCLTATTAAQDGLPPIELNQTLHDRLPEHIKTTGTLVSVYHGSFPPYTIEDGQNVTGASADLLDALGRLLGVEVEIATVAGLPAVLVGVSSGRYDVAIGPTGDFKSRQEVNDFVDWVKEYVVFLVPTGNPEAINSLESSCGKRIAVTAGGSAERVITKASEDCVAAGKEAVEVMAFSDQPQSILAIRSDRADAFFSSQAPLTYFAEQSNGELELTGFGQSNGFEDLYQGSVVAKGSPLGPVLKDAFQALIDNGAYKAIMTKWGLTNNMVEEAGMNLGGEIPK